MKFFEFGKENDRTLMIECGYLAKWYPGLMPFIDWRGCCICNNSINLFKSEIILIFY